MRLFYDWRKWTIIKIKSLNINYFLLYLFIGLLSCFLARNNWVFLLLGFSIITINFCYGWKQRWIPYSFILIIFISFLVNEILKIYQTDFVFTDIKFRVIEVKRNYLIVKNGWTKYYLSNYELDDPGKVILNQILKISGKTSLVNIKHKDYEFAFDEFLMTKNIFYEVKVYQIEFLEQGILYKINLFYNKLFSHELCQIFFLSNRDQEINLVKQMNDLSISYLLNFSGVNLLFLNWFLTKILRLFKLQFLSQVKLKLILNFLILIFSWTINFPFILTKTILFLTIRNSFLLRRKKINSYNLWSIVFVIMISNNLHLLFSATFLYYLAGLIFFKRSYHPNWTKNLVINLTIAIFTFGLITSFISYRFYYFNELISFLVAPLISFINLFVIFTFLIPKISIVYDFLLKCLSLNFNLFLKMNYFYSFGYIPIYYYLVFFGSFFWIVNKGTCSKITLIVVILTLIFFALLFIYKILMLKVGLHILEVGNGSTAIYLDHNQTIIVDAGIGTGYSKKMITSFLKYYGIDKINYLFISHAHEDHYNGIESLLENHIQIKNVIHKENALPIYNLENIQLQIFNINQKNSNENNNSLVILFITKQFNILFMGDLEQNGEYILLENKIFYQAVFENPIDLLILGHHGSKTSSSWDFIKHINPKFALISGENRGHNRFPALEVIKNLKKLNIPYWVTSQDGDFWLKM